MKKTYGELLRDPRWQRKRLEAMEAASFACEKCGDTEKTLNVHHVKYRKNAAPWEYELDELETLCEACHQAVHSYTRMITGLCSVLDPIQLSVAAGFMKAMLLERCGGQVIYTTYELIGAAIYAKGGFTAQPIGQKLAEAIQANNGELKAEDLAAQVEGRPN